MLGLLGPLGRLGHLGATVQGSKGWIFGEGKGILCEKRRKRLGARIQNLEDEFSAREKEFFVNKRKERVR